MSVRARVLWERVLVSACAVVVASPVIFNPSGYEQYQLPKLIVQSAAVIVALLALLVTDGPPLHKVLVPLGAFLAALSVSALLSHAPWTAFTGTGSRRFGVMSWLLLAAAFVVGMACSSKHRRVLLVRVLVISSAIVATYAILQRLGIDPFAPDGAGASLRPAATLGSATYLGGYLALAFGVCLAALVGKLFAWQWVAPIAAANLVAVLLTQSRGAWVGAAIAIVLVAVVAVRRSGRRVVVLVVAAAVVVVAGTAIAAPGLISRACTLTHPSAGTAGARFELAGMGLHAIADRPLLGWGPDQSRPALHNQIGPHFESKYRDDRIEDRVHNWFLDMALWSGLLGLGLFLWFLTRVVRVGFKQRGDWTVVAIGTGLIAFAGHLFFNFPIPDLDVVAWLLAGTLVPPIVRRRQVVPIYIAGMAALVTAALVLVPLLSALQADRSLRIGIDKENAHDTAGARIAYEHARSQAPDSAIYREVLTRFYLRVGEPRAAVAEGRVGASADRSDPYMAELVARALASEALNENNPSLAAEAEAKLRMLIRDSPYDGSLHLELGNALAAERQFDNATSEYMTAIPLVPYRSEPRRNLGLLYEQLGDLDKARKYLSEGLYVDPTDTTARAALERLQAAAPSTTQG